VVAHLGFLLAAPVLVLAAGIFAVLLYLTGMGLRHKEGQKEHNERAVRIDGT